MFNALWFRPDGGAERYAEYGAAVMPILAGVGAELLYPFLPVERVLEGELDPDLVGFVRYPSRDAFKAMWQSKAYQAVAHLREEAITKAILTQCEIDPEDAAPVVSLPPGIMLLNALWFRDGGAATYDTFLEAARSLVEARGGRLLTPRLRPQRALGEDFVPDQLFMGYYPSLEVVSELAGSAGYQAPLAIRADSLRQTAITVLRIDG